MIALAEPKVQREYGVEKRDKDSTGKFSSM